MQGLLQYIEYNIWRLCHHCYFALMSLDLVDIREWTFKKMKPPCTLYIVFTEYGFVWIVVILFVILP